MNMYEAVVSVCLWIFRTTQHMFLKFCIQHDIRNWQVNFTLVYKGPVQHLLNIPLKSKLNSF